MQLKPIFPVHVSKSRITPTLIGIVMFICALARKLLSERITKNKNEKETLVGIFITMFEYLVSVQIHGLTVIYRTRSYDSQTQDFFFFFFYYPAQTQEYLKSWDKPNKFFQGYLNSTLKTCVDIFVLVQRHKTLQALLKKFKP